ncbi:MAG: hypothetical protein KAQ89_00845 [Planctomycetes bacterium]|nr:hypothetical protein [Planctomycetota bacterium]
MPDKTTLVHVTHEATGKIGGIGAVLQGFFTSKSYLNDVQRSILVGPLFDTQGPMSYQLGEDGQVLYSSMGGFVNTIYAMDFQEIEHDYNAGIVYGRETFVDKKTGVKSSPEVLLVDVKHIKKSVVDDFKEKMFKRFGLRSDLYEDSWEFEQYVRLAPVAIAALKAIGATGDLTAVVAHEFMGMPTVLAAILDKEYDFKTIFYAHEVATIRRIVEEHPGQDTMFYNVLKYARNNKLYIDEVLGSQDDYFKHALIKTSKYCDTICAVGDYAADEMQFLAPEFETADIQVVYNGIPAYEIDTNERLESKGRLQQYCENLLGFKPDVILTHVTRLVRSKGLWRDLHILYELEEEFRKQGKTAVMFLLSTEVAQRRSHDIYNMESSYKWPLAHREGMPDLSGGEANFYSQIQEFNTRSRNIKFIFMNQFGFSRKSCGKKMPEHMEFMDIRKGSDVEFGLSIYEPFGIAHLESLTFGSICVVSSICGCAGFAEDTIVRLNEDDLPLPRLNGESQTAGNVIIADYTDLKTSDYADLNDLLLLDASLCATVESRVNKKVAEDIIRLLAKNEAEPENAIKTGYAMAKNMSWDVVMDNYLSKSLNRIFKKQHAKVLG